eukprot:3131036-Ditylum_brightwellii.AAC.1
MPPNVQATYYEGEEIVLDVVLTAHHKGHFEYKACPISPAPPDPNFPGRAYIAPPSHNAIPSESSFEGMKFSHTYRLPNGLNGDLVLIQWHYFTSNSCIYTGYREYTWPVGWEVSETIPECQNIPHDGNGVPEQFWNCAEVTINTTGRSSSLPATTSATQAAGDIAAITTTIPVAESTTTT